MKKSDYKDIEEILSNKAARLEKRVGYSGAVRSADLDGSANEDRHVRPHSPALQIAGAFLAAVIVGGGTFGALKYMEYKGAQIAANQSGPSEPAGYADAAEKSEYDQASPVAERADGFGEVRFINYADDFLKFKLSSRIFADAELPIENGYQSVYKVSSEEADKLGFDVFIYVDRDSAHYGGICVLDKEGGLVMDFKPAYLLSPPTCLLYAGDTPSGHQTFFFTAVQELSGPDWDWTNLYACDLVTGQITEIGSTGPNAYGSNALYTTGSLSYVESTGEILYNVYEKTYGTVIGQELTADNVIHNDTIVWDGEKYVLRGLSGYAQSGTGSQTVPAETTEPDDQTTAPYDHTTDVPDDTAAPEETTVPGAETDPGKEMPPQVFREWLLTKLQPKMTFEDLCQTVWNIETGGYQIKNDIRAAQYQQIEYGEDGTFMRYGNEGYDLTCFVENDDAETVREARLILRPGFSGLELPYGLSVDMTPVEALERMGFSAEQIAALEGRITADDGFTVTYYTTSVSFTYGLREDGYSVSMGIEISDGSDDQVYIEIEKL